MNKTISIHLGGWFFHVEEDGYRQLDSYLNALQVYFAAEQGGSEIVEDIESRIAEMFQEVLTKHKRQVIISADVHQIMRAMGNPEQFDEAFVDISKEVSHLPSVQTTSVQTTPPLPPLPPPPPAVSDKGQKEDNAVQRRFYRNPEDKFISGVCSGLAAYIGLDDPTWLRLLFVALLFLTGGTVVIAYIILMVIVPEAQTSAQKLAMRGETINLSNIEKTVKESMNNLQTSLDDFNKSEQGEKVRHFFNRVGNNIESTIPAVFRTISPIVTWVAVGIAAAITVGFAGMLVGWIISSFSAVGFLTQFIFGNAVSVLTMALSGVVAIGIPFVFLLYFVLRRTLNISGKGLRQWGGALGLLWLLSIASMSFTAARTYTGGFDASDYAEQTIQLDAPATNVLRLDVLDDKTLENVQSRNEGNMPFSVEDAAFDFKTGNYYSGNLQLDIERSTSDKFELYRKTTAKGGTSEEAEKNAQNIAYDIQQKDGILWLSPYFTAQASQWRDQEMQLTLKVPIGKAVFLSGKVGEVIYDIKNVTDTHDRKMLGHTWIMTERGLALADANLQPIFDEDAVDELLDNEDGDIQKMSAIPPTPPTPPVAPLPPTPKGDEESQDFDDYKDFTQIEVSGALDVQIVQSNTYTVKVVGTPQDLKQVVITAENDLLSISQKKGSTESLKIYIGMPHLEGIVVSGASDVRVDGFKESEMKIELTGASELKGTLEVEDLSVELSGSSEAKLHGKSEKMTVSVSGASSLKAFDLSSEEVEIELSGSADAEIFASDKINSDVSGASTLRYKGNANDIKNDITGVATVNKAD